MNSHRLLDAPIGEQARRSGEVGRVSLRSRFDQPCGVVLTPQNVRRSSLADNQPSCNSII
jgi:hypothetical protein